MKAHISYILLFIMWGATVKADKLNMSETANLKTVINEIIKDCNGTVAIAFADLVTPTTFFLNEKVRMHAASTMKVPVMIEVFRQADAGKFQLSDSIRVKNQFKSIVDGSDYSLSASDAAGDTTFDCLDKKMTIQDLVYQMITVSSNLATNILMELVGAKNVTETMRAIGADSIRVVRGLFDMKAFDAGLNNTTTAYDLMVICQAIAQNTAAKASACKKMLDIMFDTEHNAKIPAKLPPGVRVAHKTGSITKIDHDVGIIYLPDGKSYVLALLTCGIEDNDQATALLAQLSRAVYDWYMQMQELK